MSEKPPEFQANIERRRNLIEKCTREMVRLFIAGHEAQQTEEYEAWRMQYLQAQVDLMYPDLPDEAHSHWTTG